MKTEGIIREYLEEQIFKNTEGMHPNDILRRQHNIELLRWILKD